MNSRAAMTVRILLGVSRMVFGHNKIFHFFAPPPHSGDAAKAFLGGLAGSGYFFPFLGGVEALCGAALVAGLFVPLALVVLAPVMLNIVLFHLFLDIEGMAVGGLLGIMQAHLMWSYRNSFSSLLRPR